MVSGEAFEFFVDEVAEVETVEVFEGGFAGSVVAAPTRNHLHSSTRSCFDRWLIDHD